MREGDIVPERVREGDTVPKREREPANVCVYVEPFGFFREALSIFIFFFDFGFFGHRLHPAIAA